MLIPEFRVIWLLLRGHRGLLTLSETARYTRQNCETLGLCTLFFSATREQRIS